MIEATSCGGVVIYRGKILALYKSYKNRYEGWVLPKGTVAVSYTHLDVYKRQGYGRGSSLGRKPASPVSE